MTQGLNDIADIKDHSFMCDALMIPNSDKTDGSRGFMAAGAFQQAVILEHAQPPKIFSRFENQIGDYNRSIVRAHDDLEILKILKRNEFNWTYLLREVSTGKYTTFELKPGFNITESYGYSIINDILKYAEGDIIPKGEIIKRNGSYDEQGNFQYGRNLEILYMAYEGLTYEDACIISDEAAKFLTHTYIHQIDVTINTNDILVNHLGNKKTYKAFYDVGETIEDGILAVRRKINYDTFKDFSDKALMQINESMDDVFYCNGKVIDIQVFSNTEMDKIEKHPYHNQIAKYLKKQKDFDNKVYSMFTDIKKQGHETSDDINYVQSRAKRALDSECKWLYEANEFDMVVVRFTIEEKVPVKIGSKLTGRYGNKGVVSKILPKHKMPRTENGKYADIIMNPLAVFNRLIPSVLYEMELNYTTDRVIEYANRNYEKTGEKFKHLLGYIKFLNEEQYRSMAHFYNSLNAKDRMEWWKEITEEGIGIHQPPFFGNITLEQLFTLYAMARGLFIDKDDKDSPLYKFVMTSEDEDGNEIDKEIEERAILGKMYIMKLKHEPKSKLSVRSSAYISSTKDVPSKNNRRFKQSQALYSRHPVKFGEQEFMNIMSYAPEIGGLKDALRYLEIHSSNKQAREGGIRTLLSTPDIFNLKTLGEVQGSRNTLEFLNSYMKPMALEFTASKPSKK